MKEIYISNITKWAPGLSDDESLWQDWLAGKAQIRPVKDAPKLEYTDPLFRRRLSQITKMTVHVIHSLLEKSGISKDTKIFFCSEHGEIEREFSINKSLIEDNMILPAAFSLSVFNTPVSQATLAFGLKGGYSAVYPSKGNFRDAFKTAAAPVLAGTEEKIIFVYADELVPEAYAEKCPEQNLPFAFAAIMSASKSAENITISDFDSISDSPLQFLRNLIK